MVLEVVVGAGACLMCLALGVDAVVVVNDAGCFVLSQRSGVAGVVDVDVSVVAIMACCCRRSA